MSTERELIILDLLHDAGSDTFYSAQNLADQLGVSVRTVKSDINNINQTDNKSGCCGQKSQ